MLDEPNARKLKLVASFFITLTVLTVGLMHLIDLNDTHDESVAGSSTPIEFTPTVIDDYLANPGIGWQYMGGSNETLLPETVAYPDRADIAWNDIHTAENTYNWNVLDSRINAAKAEGKQISFRVYNMRGEGYGGHQIPQWAIDKGILLIGDAPDYSGCVYQDIWGKFIETLAARYDGNPDIAYIDISGYDNFNEWGYGNQVQLDTAWLSASDKYIAGTGPKPDRALITSTDGLARNRLAEMFSGGSYNNHKCKNSGGSLQTLSYNYTGFTKTQLIMPYAGIRQSTLFMYYEHPNVGFRHDCLGRSNTTIASMAKIDIVMKNLWKTQPVGYELCAINWNDSNFFKRADDLLKYSHGSFVHDNPNGGSQPQATMHNLMKYVGYRYVLKKFIYPRTVSSGGTISVSMDWQNVGYAPSYPKMGQKFKLYFYIVNSKNQITKSFEVNSTDVSKWMPANVVPATPPDNNVNQTFNLGSIDEGVYTLKVGILDERTNKNIMLGIAGGDGNNLYNIGPVKVTESDIPVSDTVYNMHLDIVSLSDTTQLDIGETLTLNAVADLPNIDNNNPNSSELVINFDPDVLTGVSITENTGFLGLNKNIDNINGKMTIDIVKETQNIVGSEVLANLVFTVKSKPAKTNISIDTSTTLGIPNQFNIFSTTLTREINFGTPVPVNLCGNGVLDSGEQCDDNNNNNGDGCSFICLFEMNASACGNGIVEDNEVCDMGTRSCTRNGYAGTRTCRDDCSGYASCQTIEYCGDGIQNGTEVCDDGNTANNDLCASNCLAKCTAPQTWDGIKCISPVVVVQKPNANFIYNVSEGRIPVTVQFTDTSTNNPTSWLWNFGDGTTSTLKNPSHTYTLTGKFTVSLSVYNSGGADTEVKTTLIHVAPSTIWSDWQQDSSSSPSPVSLESFNGRLYQTVRGSNYPHKIYIRSSTDGVFDGVNSTNGDPDIKENWNAIVNGTTAQQPSLAVFKNRLYLTAVEQDTNRIIMKSMDNNEIWDSAWEISDDIAYNGIAVKSFTVNNEERLYQALRHPITTEVMVRYSTDGVFDISHTQENWTNIGGKSEYELELEVFNNTLHLAANGTSTRIFIRNTKDGTNWSNWSEYGGNSIAGPDMAVYNNQLCQIVVGNSTRIFIRCSSDTINWPSWEELGGGTYKKISLTTFNGRLYQGVVGRSGNLFLRFL